MVYLFLCCAYRFRNHRLLFVSTIDSLETPVITLSYGGLGHGHDGGLDVADAGCTGRNVLSVSVVLWLMCVQRMLRSVCGVFRSPDPIYSNRSSVGSAGVAVSRSSTLPSTCRNQRRLRLTTMPPWPARMRAVTYYYSQKCPAPGCTEAAWKRSNKCRGTSMEEAVAKLKHHLHASKLHYMKKG